MKNYAAKASKNSKKILERKNSRDMTPIVHDRLYKNPSVKRDTSCD